MKCYLCDSHASFGYWLKPDKYQKLVDNTYNREWFCCESCGLWQQYHNLTDNDLQNIYLNYRNQEMRHTTVKDEFDRILSLPDSENEQRIDQLKIDGCLWKRSTLDIGSGLGVFPFGIKSYVKDIKCVEPNPDSAEFINNKLGIECHEGFYKPGMGKFSFITAIHVLEHTRDPVKFIADLRNDIENDGLLYIEVPDACEFDYLPESHDEFNSSHLFMFDVSTLDRILRKGGFEPYLIRRLKYQKRHLSRITMLCRISHA